jgi:tryptophan-rich sensory protein
MQWLKLIISIAVPNIAGMLGALFTSAGKYYQTLNRPALSPPGWVFGPVWTTLYTLMGISFYLIWTSNSKLKEYAVIIFLIQLILNAIWSPIFFGLQAPLAALIEMIFLNIAIIATIVIFYQISRPAAYLLIPYLMWVLFATYLTFEIVRLN